MEKTIWDKLKPFETFMVKWCDEEYDQDRVEKSVLYHGATTLWRSRTYIATTATRADNLSIPWAADRPRIFLPSVDCV